MSTLFYSKELPVRESADVVIAGGGPAGIGAALSAARKGIEVLLIERFGFPGGMATAGFVNPMSEFSYNGEQVTGGIAWEFAQALVAAGGGLVEAPRCNISFNPEIYKLVAEKMLLQAGVRLLMNTVLCDVVTAGDRITHVIAENKDGLFAIEGKTFIDATGDADLSAFAGVEMLPHSEKMQPGTLCFTMGGVDTTTERMHIIHQKNHRFNHQALFIREPLLRLREHGEYVPQFGGPWLADTLVPGQITVNMTRSAMDATDSRDYQEAEFRMREDVFRLAELIRTYVEEFRNAYVASVATVAGVRESRRIKGVHVLTGEEYLRGVHFEDAIARACHPVDIHLPDGEGQKLTFPGQAGYIPFRSLITEQYANLLAAGRCISADNEAFAAIRVQAPCMETGQAAGLAAALCLRDRRDVRRTDIPALVREVREAGSFV